MALRTAHAVKTSAGRAHSARDAQCLALAIYHEAGSGPATERKLVGQVALNRAAASTPRKPLCTVVYLGLRCLHGSLFKRSCRMRSPDTPELTARGRGRSHRHVGGTRIDSMVLHSGRERRGALVAAAVLAAMATTPIEAGTFDVKAPEVKKGETEVSTNHSVQARFPVNSDFVRYSSELAAGYGFTDWFKAGSKINGDLPVGETWQLSTAGLETQLYFGKLAPGILWGWYTGVDVRVHESETNTVIFGPLVQFGDDKLSLTLNGLFEQTFGANREDGTAFSYAAGLKREVQEGIAIGIEAHGSIPDIGNWPSADFQEHRIGPVLYLDGDIGKARNGGAAPKLAIEIGGFVGLTEATPDLTGKLKASLTW